MALPNESAPPQNKALESIRRAIFSSNAGMVAGALVTLNLLTTFIRPQHHLPALGTIKLPLVIGIATFIAWVARGHFPRSVQFNAMCGILLLGAATGPFAVNTFHSFNRWRGMVQLFACLIFPLMTIFASGRDLRRITNILIFLAFYLGIFSLTHKGTGPGDFLIDENDMCFALNFLTPFALFFLLEKVSPLRKLGLLTSVAAALGGVVATISRGGFIGIVSVLGYAGLRSRRKVLMILFLVVVGAIAALFAPREYWTEMSTIQHTDQGTAKTRREFWTVATIVWLTPRNFVQGVGMGNTPIVLDSYAPDWVKSKLDSPMWGRAVHSMYLELLPDLGILGFFLFLAVVVPSVRGNRRIQREVRLRLREIDVLRATEPSGENSELLALLPRIRSELLFVLAFAIALNGAWIGVLITGAFISVLYYPPLWLAAALSVSLAQYWRRLESPLVSLLTKEETL